MRGILACISLFVIIVIGSIGGCGGGPNNNQQITIRVVGEEEVVFDWATQKCEDIDMPDLPARAFRDDSGQVQLIASHGTVRRFIGPDLNNLTHECDIVMESDRDPDPAAFNDGEWIGSTYTEDGKTIYTIVHNEYHGWEHPGQCSITQPEFFYKCWYNSLTLAVSTDSGASYQHPVAPPGHLIAAYPERYILDTGNYGIFHPSNIVKGKDGYYYSMVQPVTPTGESGACLIRTDDLSDPKSWRFWDGEGFDGIFINPYTEATDNPEAHVCKTLEGNEGMTSSLTYNNYIDRYILIGLTGGGESSGFYYSVSDDLINWTPFRLFLHVELPWTVDNPTDPSYVYPSLLDPDSESRNFETTGETPYLYYTRYNDGGGDLLRIQVEIVKE